MLHSRDIPNIITIARIFLAVPVVWALLNNHFGVALILFIIAGVSDGVDGFLAKQFHWQSRLGSLLDPLADKLLLVSCYLSLGWLGLVPWWLIGVIILRDLLIVGGATYWDLKVERLEAEPTIISKINTFVQIVLVVSVVADQVFHFLPDGSIVALIWITFATTVSSGADYVWVWSKRAQQATHGKGDGN